MAKAGDLLNVAAAASLLGVTDRHVRKLIAEGLLPATRFGRAHVIRRADVDKVPKRKPGPKPKPSPASNPSRKGK